MNKKERLEELAKALGLPEFDLLLVADGSGSFWGTPCGWFCTAYEKDTGAVFGHAGGALGGTNNYAELQPFVYALQHYHSLREKNGAGKKDDRVCVSLVSDSEITVRCGNGEYERRANAPLWASIAWFEKNGYALAWKHVPRNSNEFNTLADKVAGKVREGIQSLVMSA